MFFLQDDTLHIPFVRASCNEYDVEPLVAACNPRFGDYQWEDSAVLGEAGVNMMKPSETERQSDAMAVQRAFASAKK
ncbi:ABC transporter D family member 1, partial [Camellia lanceoleosa]